MPDPTLSPAAVDPMEVLTPEEREQLSFVRHYAPGNPRSTAVVAIVDRLAAELTAARAELRRRDEVDRCPTCRGEGWMMDGEHDGEMCPDCQNPMILGGTGLKGGIITRDLGAKLDQQEHRGWRPTLLPSPPHTLTPSLH